MCLRYLNYNIENIYNLSFLTCKSINNNKFHLSNQYPINNKINNKKNFIKIQ